MRSHQVSVALARVKSNLLHTAYRSPRKVYQINCLVQDDRAMIPDDLGFVNR